MNTKLLVEYTILYMFFIGITIIFGFLFGHIIPRVEEKVIYDYSNARCIPGVPTVIEGKVYN
jgi:hypothetical protein